MATGGYAELRAILCLREGCSEEPNQVLEQLRDASLAEPGYLQYRIAQSSVRFPTVVANAMDRP